jgi:hypothetical protein
MLDITVGAVLGALVGSLYLAGTGNAFAVSRVLTGQGEDALHDLASFLIMGALIGCAVGLFHACLRDEPYGADT